MHFVHTPGTHTGYSRYGTKLEAALRLAGYRCSPLHRDSEPEHLAVWVTTPSHVRGWFDGQHKVLSTMWETETIPEAFRESLHNFDLLIVPSHHNLAMFGQYHDRVEQVPLGVDSWDWRFRPRTPPAHRFVFLVCGNGSRKGVDLAVRAFQKVFPVNAGTCSRPILQIKSAGPADIPLASNIQNVTGFLSDTEEQNLYAAAHVFLAPSRGEGFGLQPLQAIAQGCPTILTDAHGHEEFASLGWGVKAGRSKADYFLHGDGGQWWEPDFDQLCGRMEQIYRSYDTAMKDAEASSAIAHELFSWERCAARFMDAVGPVCADRVYRGEGRWCVPELKRYPVKVTHFWCCSVAGTEYQFHPGVEYFETADVKRILYEQGLLDPACVNPAHPDATGLTEAQLERFGDYSASHSYCHACGQKLGTGEVYLP